MGAGVWNYEHVTDWTTRDTFLRMHLDIPLGANQSNELRTLFEANDIDGVRNLLKNNAPVKIHKSIDAILDTYVNPKG